ncbi:NAD(P)-dependent dehydrogenase (short-subunit alcohol dehydrogenase family) [Acinetobacter calcoaceticus]|uniref:NAD(P)-dependent dehydrogenase (Short-subunit alcohol dehydrogenase family) n=1 Tax=Acinetobacter calcoaceticus TaxID=471 RepID=A0A4R1Y9T0_ACICA|nr:NAD(P)-dependent dehydrogenase (short-subunit alcohol dehydrogenase family) [Acinetobacter calcoaceticus]
MTVLEYEGITLHSQKTFQPSTVLITGGTRGIGLGLAKAFLTLGWSVVISARNNLQLTDVVAELGLAFDPDRVYGVACDVTQHADLQQLWDKAVAHFGQLNVWINNAGSCNTAKAFKDIDPVELEHVVQTNILGSILGSQVALNGMLQQGHGQIFNMEGWGSRGEWSAGMTAYATSKRAVSYFTQALYKESKHSPIKVGTLSPGMVATDLLISSWEHGDAANWRKMKWLFMFVIDPAEPVCSYLAKQVSLNTKTNTRIVWMTPLRLISRFLQPYYWRRNPVQGTALDQLGKN